MQKIFHIITILYFSFLTAGCESGRYSQIAVETGLGREIIPGSCSAWTDGCDTYCRANHPTSWYKGKKLKTVCKNEDLHASECIDDQPEKLKLCKEENDDNK